MAQVYFHCSNAEGVLVDRRGVMVADLAEACEHATGLVRCLISSLSPDDWRDWTVHISDDAGDEIVAIPFSSQLGRLH
ncbi:MAG: hypothetical protein P4M07_19745 [Xanthobacteraceae bacterium]|nr:hypothetical protein [Xanthobacteraceae bacterium]